jgi:hypothetical protein
MSWTPDYDRDHEENGPPPEEDRCPVCEHFDCTCPPEPTALEIARAHDNKLYPNLTPSEFQERIKRQLFGSASVGSEIPNQSNETGDGYPIGWPKCPSCGAPALDGHITCGQAMCNEGAHR